MNKRQLQRKPQRRQKLQLLLLACAATLPSSRVDALVVNPLNKGGPIHREGRRRGLTRSDDISSCCHDRTSSRFWSRSASIPLSSTSSSSSNAEPINGNLTSSDSSLLSTPSFPQGTALAAPASHEAQGESSGQDHHQQVVLSSSGDVSNNNGNEKEANEGDNVSSSSSSTVVLREVDVLYGRSHALLYDETKERFVQQFERNHTTLAWTPQRLVRQYILPQLSVAFLPSGVTPNYYRFMRWRVLQRFVSANLHVFGTQSLLMGLGIKSSASQLGALSAALKWVLKDALGKIVRMAWASHMGRRFDSDAKRWRFRSAFIFAAGNFLEITTYMLPSMFLVWATLANCCKQMSMLTSSSTRTALYNSFRDGTRENIGDITAKGEAQIAIVDLLGIASGVCLSRTVGTSVRRIVAVYGLLQSLEIMCMYRQLRAVVYRVLNFERMLQVITQFVEEFNHYTPEQRKAFLRGGNSVNNMPTPATMAAKERIFLPPPNLSRRAMAFGSLGRARLSPAELGDLRNVFATERFLLVVGANIKHHARRRWPPKSRKQRLQENCHIVLHSEATNVDIVKSTLALTLLRDKLAARDDLDPDTMRSADCLDVIAAAQQEADDLFYVLLRQLAKHGWESPARFMFGRVHMRAEWPLVVKKKSGKTSEEDKKAASS